VLRFALSALSLMASGLCCFSAWLASVADGTGGDALLTAMWGAAASAVEDGDGCAEADADSVVLVILPLSAPVSTSD
jgi:hypothetical protein